MSACLVVTARISDPLAFRAYAQKVAALVTTFGGLVGFWAACRNY